MEYFESIAPSGDGYCSDNACPCPGGGVLIPRGTGYLYIEQWLVEFRRKYPTLKSADQAMQQAHEKRGRELESSGTNISYSGFYRLDPILVCEQGAKLRNLDLEVAAADAKYWWETGKVPLRTTPLCKSSQEVAKRNIESETNTRAEKSEQVQKQAKEKKAEIFEILMDAICCVMCADKKITTREREAVHKILEKTKAPWNRDEVDNRINAFVQQVKKNGLEDVIQKTCKNLPVFKKIGKEDVLFRCIDYMMRADREIDEREQKLCDKFRKAVTTEKVRLQTKTGRVSRVKCGKCRKKQSPDELTKIGVQDARTGKVIDMSVCLKCLLDISSKSIGMKIE
jgi:hypothetical protein